MTAICLQSGILLFLLLGGRALDGTGIENFDTGSVVLTSYPGEDQQPSGWNLDSTTTHNASPFSLRLTGNTWKIETISPYSVDSGDVWSVAAFIQQTGEIQGFGVRDSAHELLFAFAGTEQLDPATWVTVYQGAFPTGAWNDYRLPVADAWLSRFGYLPTLTGLVFVNDRDTDPTSVVLFDDIEDISSDLPVAPSVAITYTPGAIYRSAAGHLSVDVQFFSQVSDPDSGTYTYFWRFGDDSTSTAPNPRHTFLVNDDHAYRVLLEVTDSSGLTGRATCVITVDPGPTSFPLSMNFVGDIMLARNYEAPGGIIPTRGVEAIFAPTRSVLGDSADITVANLECPLTQTGTPHPTKPIVFRGSPANAAGLVYAGIDVVSLANNHVIDYGLAGLDETRSTLRQRGIAFSGAGATSTEAYEPVFLSRSGLTFGFLAFSDRTGQYNNDQPYLDAGENKPGFANLTIFALSREIADLRADADIVVVEMHSGVEYSIEPTLAADPGAGDEGYSPVARAPLTTDREVRRHALEAGADVVICHHPHITQGFEVYQGKLIAHSLGNFAFDLGYTETFPSVILRAEIGPSGITGYTVVPVYIDDYIPMRAQGDLGRYILDDLAMKSRELGTILVVDRAAVTGRILLDTLALLPRQVSRTVSVPLHQSGSDWVSSPIRIPRIGSLVSVSGVTPAGGWSARTGRELVWMGNVEDEGCSLWDLGTTNETFDTTVAHAGHRSLRHRRTAGSGTLVTSLERRLKTWGGPAYSLCSWITTSGARNVTARVNFYDSRTGVSEIGSGDIGTTVSGTTGWTSYANDFSAPAGTAFLDLELESTGPTAGTGYAWFDDIGVVEWTPWSPTGQTIAAPNDFSWIQVRSSTPVANATITYVEQQYTDAQTAASIDVAVTTGWNMVSNPLTLPDSMHRVRSLYPHSTFDYAFAFSSEAGYIQSMELTNGPGSAAVASGWNMIGSVSTPVDTSALSSVPAGLLSSIVYGYSGGYFPAEQIMPGAAYWVKCRGAGRVILSGSAPRRVPAKENAGPRTLLTLTFRDAAGRTGTLLLRSAGDHEERYELPPLPPGEALDVRFSPGQMAVAAGQGSTGSHPIGIRGAVYPLTVGWQLHDSRTSATLVTGTRRIHLNESGAFSISGSDAAMALLVDGIDETLPAEFALGQNFPNPFNPSTSFRYAVPVRGEVFLGVYAVTGQLVRTLHSGELPAGFHQAVWDGCNDAGMQVGSGVYFARMTSGTFRQARKLLLLR
jgi:poly-gamma-glutamate capsule biosynthesis protein CapA/YwtB (metallophosphatase superfamily)